MATGYHYTSLRCWKGIQKEGLIPYLIWTPELRQYIGKEEVTGIWLWENMLSGLSHIGSIIYQMGHKNTTQAVLLSVLYSSKMVLTAGSRQIVLHHSGQIENLEYHDGTQNAVIHLNPISPKRIQLIGEYDLLDIWTS